MEFRGRRSNLVPGLLGICYPHYQRIRPIRQLHSVEPEKFMLKSLEPRGFEPLPPHYNPASSVVDPDRTDRVRERCRFEQVLTNSAGVRLKSLLTKSRLCSTYNRSRFPETNYITRP